jgi:long-chain acyl-CoA synthetase
MSTVEIFEKYIKSRIWTKNYDEGVPPEVEIRPVPLFTYLDRQTSENGGRTAYIYFNNKVSFKTVGEHSDRVAAALKEWGIGKGSAVAIYLPNTPAFPVIYYAALKLGAVVTPMNPLYTPREIAWQAKDAGARVIFAADVLYKNVEEAAKMHQFDRVVVVEVAEYMPSFIKPLAKMKLKPPKIQYTGRVVSYRDLLKYAPTSYRANVDPTQDLAAFMYTGGTTGLPKGAEITHANISSNLQQLKPLYDAVRRKRGSQHAGDDGALAVVPHLRPGSGYALRDLRRGHCSGHAQTRHRTVDEASAEAQRPRTARSPHAIQHDKQPPQGAPVQPQKPRLLHLRRGPPARGGGQEIRGADRRRA